MSMYLSNTTCLYLHNAVVSSKVANDAANYDDP